MPDQISPLRQRMIDDMSLRNMSTLTQAAYIRAVKNFSKHYGKSPDKLTFEDVRQYQLSLVGRGLGAQAVNQIMCALRFLYKTTIGIKDARDHIALARRSDPLPAILSRQEVSCFLEAAHSVKYRTAFATIYAAGLRVSETFCVYLAKDEAIIRKHAEISGFPATKITEVKKMIDPTTAAP